MTTAQAKASARYDANHTTGLYLKFNNKTDADILKHLDSTPNKQGYIKELIRADMAREGKEMFISKRMRKSSVTGQSVPEATLEGKLVAVDAEYFYSEVPYTTLYGVPVVTKVDRNYWEYEKD